MDKRVYKNFGTNGLVSLWLPIVQKAIVANHRPCVHFYSTRYYEYLMYDDYRLLGRY